MQEMSNDFILKHGSEGRKRALVPVAVVGVKIVDISGIRFWMLFLEDMSSPLLINCINQLPFAPDKQHIHVNKERC